MVKYGRFTKESIDAMPTWDRNMYYNLLVEETENVRRQQEKANQPKPTTSKARRR